MKKYSILFALFIAISSIITVSSCTKDEDDDSKAIASALSNACTEWGVSAETVNSRMKGYSKEAEEVNYLQYSSNRLGITISYQFEENQLTATSIVFEDKDEDTDISKYFKEYTYVGELNNTEVYSNETNNVLGVSYTFKDGENNYRVVGYTPIE